MMQWFTDLNGVLQYLNKVVVDGVQHDISQRIYDIIRSYLLKNLYNRYQPQAYIRTYELLNSLTIGDVVRNGLQIYANVYFDVDKIYPHRVHGSIWNQHMSIKGEDVSAFIPEWMEYGHRGLWTWEGGHFIDDARNEIEMKYIDWIKQILSKEGIALF